MQGSDAVLWNSRQGDHQGCRVKMWVAASDPTPDIGLLT